MVTGQDLPSVISDYITRAQGSETTRQALVDRISGVVKTQIIPELIPLLPPRYSIDPNLTEVMDVGSKPLLSSHITNPTHDAVPTGVGVYLTLFYDQVPAYLMNIARNDIKKIQEDLKPKLEELAQRYNLEIILGERVFGD